MQSKHRWVVNAALAVCAVLMATRLAGDWKRGNERYARFSERSGARPSVTVPPAAGRAAVFGGDAVAKNLFSPDRNNDRPEEARLQVQPPLPVVIGTMRLAQGFEALMAEAGQTEGHRFRRVKAGQEIGGYIVAEIRDEAVVVEFQGRKSEINVYQSARSVRPAAPVARPPMAVSQGPVVETAGSAPAPAAATALAPSAAAAAAASARGVDLTPPFPGVTVTIEGNRKRFERPTAFGPQVWYEDIR